MYFNGHAINLPEGNYYFSTSSNYLIQLFDGGILLKEGYGSVTYSISSTKTLTLYINTPNEGDTYSINVDKYTNSDTNGKSTGKHQGGGTSGKGEYPGTQSSSGHGGAQFGLGASQISYNYRYCSGGGGAGWYGGGKGYSDNHTDYIDFGGGGSGFVNIATNASYRPSEYTGLQLESGTTIAGDTSHPSISGGTETGHSGNGYAIITVL